jgi:hypothetical protein
MEWNGQVCEMLKACKNLEIAWNLAEIWPNLVKFAEYEPLLAKYEETTWKCEEMEKLRLKTIKSAKSAPNSAEFGTSGQILAHLAIWPMRSRVRTPWGAFSDFWGLPKNCLKRSGVRTPVNANEKSVVFTGSWMVAPPLDGPECFGVELAEEVGVCAWCSWESARSGSLLCTGEGRWWKREWVPSWAITLAGNAFVHVTVPNSMSWNEEDVFPNMMANSQDWNARRKAPLAKRNKQDFCGRPARKGGLRRRHFMNRRMHEMNAMTMWTKQGDKERRGERTGWTLRSAAADACSISPASTHNSTKNNAIISSVLWSAELVKNVK